MTGPEHSAMADPVAVRLREAALLGSQLATALEAVSAASATWDCWADRVRKEAGFRRGGAGNVVLAVLAEDEAYFCAIDAGSKLGIAARALLAARRALVAAERIAT
jgi:hypothetical protein